MRKLSKRAIITFIIAILLTIMVPIVPVMADAYTDEEFASGPTGSDAVWATDPATVPTRGDVAKISIDSGGDWAQVRIFPDTALTLAELDAELIARPIVYDYYMGSGAATDHPDIELRFENSTGDGYVEVGIYTYEAAFATGTWYTVAAYDLTGGSGVGLGHVTAYGMDNGGSAGDIDEGGSMSTSDIVTAILAVNANAGDWVLKESLSKSVMDKRDP